ncbi:MAG: hypothetical protein HKN26_06405 [Acidimicrobiales bacterium]|nr:hypothetical protein [Acidimicrobiales bacterium]
MIAVPVGFLFFAALGAAARAEITHRMPGTYGVPLATLLVNVVGSFVLGLLTGSVGLAALTVVGSGGLGALTTYSTFVTSCHQMGDRHPGQGVAYVAVTIVAGVFAAEFGLALSS